MFANDHSAADPPIGSEGIEEATSGRGGTQCFDSTDWLSFGIATLSVFAGYLLTLAPDVTLGFSGIFTTGAAYAGVPHPPGYPVFTLWGWMFTKLLPFSNIAWRVAVSSAVAGALSCGLIALMVSRIGAGLTKPFQHDPIESGRPLRVVSGFVAGLVFGFNGSFWGLAVIADTLALNVLLLCAVLCLLLKWSFIPKRRRYLWAALFTYGLAVTNSQMLLVAAPAIPFLILSGSREIARNVFLSSSLLIHAVPVANWTGYISWPYEYMFWPGSLLSLCVVVGLVMAAMGVGLIFRTRRLFSEWKVVMICTGSFLLGLALYFYVPIASMTNPPMNWGYPRTVQGFVHTLTRGQYERIHPTEDFARLLQQTWIYAVVAAKEFGWPYLPFAIAPFFFFRKMPGRERSRMFGLLATFLCLTLLLLAVVNPAPDRLSLELNKYFFSYSYVVLAIGLGCGLILIGQLVCRPPAPSLSVNPGLPGPGDSTV